MLKKCVTIRCIGLKNDCRWREFLEEKMRQSMTVMWHVKWRNAVEISVPVIQGEKKGGTKSGRKTERMEAGN